MSTPKAKFANLYRTFGSDPELEQRGVDIAYHLLDGATVTFRIKRAGARNAAWKVAYNRVMKPHEERIQKGEVGEEEMKALLAEVYAESVVIGWSGIKDEADQEVPFSREACRDLLTFLPDLFSQIIADAHNRSNYQEKQQEQTEKN